MKNLSNLIAVMITAGIMLFSCSPEKIDPANEVRSAEGDPHPALDTVCSYTDPLFLIREDDSSAVVNKCYGQGGVPMECPPGQPSWGNYVLYEGLYQGVNYVDLDFVLAAGWYADYDNWEVAIASEFEFDQNGFPVVDDGWETQVITPAENQWQLRIPVDGLPTPCFDIAVRVHGLKLSLFGFPIAGSETFLWPVNSNWNVPSHPARSESPYLLHFCPTRCEPPQDTTLTGGHCYGCKSSNTVRFDTGNPNCVEVTSCKVLDNVVVRDCNGVDYKFDNLTGDSGTFCHPSGLPITHVWVKSGCFRSCDGPDYGRRFENPFDVCN